MIFRQMIGMAAYEFRMHWRRRTLQVATLSLMGLSLIILLVLGNAVVEIFSDIGAASPDASRNIVPFFWVPVYFVILVLYGPMMAEVIPLDQNVGVRELLDSLPLKREIYLTGKLLGMFLALLSSLLTTALVVGVASWFVYGGFDIPAYIQMWLIGVIPMALLNPGLSLFLAAGQPSRRRAAAIGGGLAIISMALFAGSVNTMLRGQPNPLLDSLNPARPAILRYFLPANVNGDAIGTVISTGGSDIVTALMVGLIELLLAGSVIWWWMRWRESRT